MPSQRKRSESPSVVIPSAGAIPSIFDLSSLPSDTPRGKVTGTGHGGDDLSLSDLSVIDARAPATEDAPRNQWDDEDDDYEPAPFRLLNESPAPRRIAPDPEPDEQEPEEEEEGEGDMTMSQLGAGPRRANETIIDDDEREMSIHTPQRSTRSMVDSPQLSHSRSRTAAERREEQLHAALFQLRKMNAVFGDYVGALEAVDANTERLERQVERTNAILDRYVKMLGQQEQITKLVLDEEWRGGEADEQIVQERIEELARQERERKEREERERREREEREREEAERAQAEQEARERAAKAAGTTRGRGVRGTATRGASTVRGRTSTTAGAGATTGAGRGTVARPPSAAAGSKIGRPSSVSSTRGAVPRPRGRGAA